MPSKVTGRIEKVRRNKKLTPHKKNHRWQSFSKKIAQFSSLQPLRRVRRHDLENEDLSATTSYFRNGLDRWTELNLSKDFMDFRRQVSSISDSLPQILHFEAKIMDHLAEHIALQDAESLEPLLDLLTAFAHDLGSRFEKHYGRSLELIIAIAGKPQPAEVIEWTFGAVAFLFKYLSKLIVPSLQPTYDVVSVLMGKTRHPSHIARFAAEAMSFLIRKAASPSHRESALVPLVAHIRDEICSMVDDKQYSLYRDGIMTMFAEAIKGNEGTVHSVGPAIFTTLMDAIPETETNLQTNLIWTDMVCSVLTSTIHHCRSETFDQHAEAIHDKIDEQLQTLSKTATPWKVAPLIKILGTLAGVRKGNRISNWPRLAQQTVQCLAVPAGLPSDELSKEQINAMWPSVMVNVAMIWHSAPVDALIAKMSGLLQALTREPYMRWFISFCAYFCELDSRRFGSLFRQDFQKFIASHWSETMNEETLCVLLPGMTANGAFPPSRDKDSLKIPQSWQDQIVSKFENLEISPFPERGPYNKDPQVWRDKCLPKYAALFRILEIASLHPSTNARIAELLLRKLKLALRPSESLASDEVNFIVSQGFHSYLGMSSATSTLDTGLNPLLRAAVPRFARSLGFLKGYHQYTSKVEGASVAPSPSAEGGSSWDEDPVIKSLVANLGSPTHEIRLISLQILRNLTPASSSIADLMIEIEQIPLSLENTRTISMLLRKLSQEYNALEDRGWIAHGVPAFLFGMLTVKLSPVWDDAVASLKHIAETKTGEVAIAEIGLQWLEVPSQRWTPKQPDSSGPPRFYSDFECTNLNGLLKTADKIYQDSVHSDDVMLSDFDEAQALTELFAQNARSKALKVFNAIPAIVEKRSRQLVPHFLCWAGEEEIPDDDEEPEEAEGSTWSLIDRKALIGVFSQFVNPRVLYQHEKVYEALLQAMKNGDIEVQKSVLKAILAWKQEGVKAYQENLEFLLDEARFKNELSVFLQNDELIKAEHRAELMPVLLRLLYGRTISKKGAASGKHGLQATRNAVIRNLSIADMGEYLSIASGKLNGVRVGQETEEEKLTKFAQPIITLRMQVGFLNMISALISELGSNVSQYMDRVLNPVLYCLVFACRQLRDAAEEDAEGEKVSNLSLLRVVRSLGIKCLIALFQNAQDFQWEPYHDIIIDEVVAPRIDNLPTETTQGVSGTMQLFSTWANLPRAALFLAPHGDKLTEGVLPKLIDLIAIEKAKDEARICAMEILQNLVKLAMAPAAESEFNELIRSELLDANVNKLLVTVTSVLLEQTTSPAFLESCVETILAFAPIVSDLDNIQSVLTISSYLLNQQPRRVSPKTKGRILLVVEGFISSSELSVDAALLDQVYDTLSSLFGYFKDRENRQALCRALAALSRQDADVAVVANYCSDLNAFKEGRVEEPNYDKRLAAFSAISAARETPLTPKQWLPLLHNMIFFIRVDEEFGILASNSADCMRRLIQNAADAEEGDAKEKLMDYLKANLIPALHSGARELSETVRRETLRVFGFLISTLPTWEPVADLAGLLEGMSEDSTEPPFFFNILSPAVARQLEAMKMLEAANEFKEMGSQSLAHFFLPMLEHFIFDRLDGSDDQGLGAQAINTIGCLAQSLQWSHYRTTFQRYISYIGSKPELQRQTVRLAARFADALENAVEANDTTEQMEVDGAEASNKKRLSVTVPKQEQLNGELLNSFLPTLLKYLHEKDESEVSFRVPVGVIVVKLLKMLPEAQMEQKLAGVLTDICHILRSKSVESRDMTRDTLTKIAVVLGSRYFGFILKELRSALTRGYQLHVLSYTMHSILLAVIPIFTPGDLDHCLGDIVTVIMDDIFGVVGQEKDAEGYTSQTKEIKSSKSQDSMELVAKNASVKHLVDLVKPLQAMLMQKVDLKIVRKIDALMARISAGLLQNAAAESRDTLVFCYEVIQEVYASEKPEAEVVMDPRIRKYLVQKGAKRSGDRGKTAKHTHKLIRFAFDILRSMFKKYDSLRTPANLSGFLPILGDVFVGGEEEVKTAAFRLLTVIARVPLEGEDGKNIYKVSVREATKSISMSSSTETDLAQAALKFLSVVLRDRKDIEVKPAAIDMLLAKLKDDFTEPLYRHVTFNFLRSVLERQIETAVVYDTLDHVGTVMITNDDKDTRDLARGAFFQFVREYPQRKARWTKQLDFVVANLKYSREGGRLSVMEMLHLLLTKASNEFTQEIASTCFLPLFMALANDESEKCCMAAGELLKEIFRKSDKEHTQKFLGLLRSWIDKDDSSPVVRLGIQVFGYYFEGNEAAEKNKKDLKLLLDRCGDILAQETDDVDDELLTTTLNSVQLLTNLFQERLLISDNDKLWDDVAKSMQHRATSVRLPAIRLLGAYLTDFAKNGGSASTGQPIEGSYGLKLTTDKMQEFVRLAFYALGGAEVDEAVAAEASQILIFLGPRLPDLEAEEEEEEEAGEDDDEAEQPEDDLTAPTTQKDLAYVFRRLSHILRRETAPRAPAIVGKVSAMEILETISRRISQDRLRASLKVVLEPLQNLTDPSIPTPYSSDELFKTKYEAIKTRAQILMDSLQRKFGTAEYSKVLLEIREKVRAKRQERSSKRKIEAIAQPEKYGRDKRKRFEKDKVRRKIRSNEQREMRNSYKRW